MDKEAGTPELHWHVLNNSSNLLMMGVSKHFKGLIIASF